MREREIEKYLVKRVKELGGMAYKFVSPGNDGVPDRLLLFPGGRIMFVELKAPGKIPTRLQQMQMEIIRSLGFDVDWASSKADVDVLLRRYGGGKRIDL